VSRSVYLTAMGPASGKSVVALGLVELLSRRAGRVGFFRPIVQSLPDNDLDLIRSRYELPDERVGTAFTVEELRRLGGDVDASERGMARAVREYKRIEALSDIVVVEGSDFAGASSPLEFALNAQFARHLGSPVLAVVNGHDRSVSEIVERIRVSEQSLRARAHEILGVIVNRVDTLSVDAVHEALAERPSGAPPVWTIPEVGGLRRPSLAQLGEALDAELFAGRAEDLLREVNNVKVAAMTIPNALEYVEEGTVMLVPGDRPDILVAAALTRRAANYPGVAGVLLTGGIEPDKRVTELIDAAGDGHSPLPMLLVKGDTFQTSIAAERVEAAITPENTRKADAALGLFSTHVDVGALEERIALADSHVVTPVMFQYELLERARAAGTRIVLPEGNDDRILEAADRIVRRGVCEVTLLGDEATVRQRIAHLDLELPDVDVVDPLDSELLEQFAQRYHELRGHKGITLQRSHDIMTDVSYFGTMMVKEGIVDGMVSGAAHTTAHTIRPALEFIKTKPGTAIVSSVFLMLLADRVLVYGDCAVNPDPDAAALADIAISSAETAMLFGIEPRVAMLSYSTGASGGGADVDKVREATERVRRLRPDLQVEGPIQYDAAIDAEVGQSKLPGSDVAGHANVFVFPDLNTGNNTYKAVQRSAGAVAVGPVLQGLNQPINDLSRGAMVTDIVNTVAITAIQAGGTT